ncbi:MAG: DegT/DnrJ/EryC1/StrS family aminotransferase [Christensenellaceae bacterium]|jgi:perosamine synthetase
MIPIAKPQMTADEIAAVTDVLTSGMIASGNVVSEFENAFAEYIGVRHGIATTSGTTALEVALRALEIGRGDKVLTTAYSFIASTNSILYTGARPVFADIDPDTFCIDLKAAAQQLEKDREIKAILIVHLFGHPCDMDGVMALAQKYGLKVVEDCAQSHGAMWKNKKTGSFGDVSTFSFYPTKNMTTGEGGMVLANSDTVAERARLLINHGMKVRYTHDIIGYNYRMTNIAAAIGLKQLQKLDGFNDARRKNAAGYGRLIEHPSVIKPTVKQDAHHVYHQYTIRVTDGKRDALIKQLEENDIGYGVFYPKSIPEQPCYKDMGFETAFENTDRVKREVLSLPVHPLISEADVAAVARAINSL